MNEVNPYQSPEADCEMQQPADEPGIWRKGRALVVHRDAVMPMICVKTNVPVDHTAPLNVEWKGFINSGKYTIAIPIQMEYWRRYRKSIWIYRGAIVVCLVLLYFALTEELGDVFRIALIATAIIVSLVSWFTVETIKSTRHFFVTITKATDTYTWLDGVDTAVLDRFPEWPN